MIAQGSTVLTHNEMEESSRYARNIFGTFVYRRLGICVGEFRWFSFLHQGKAAWRKRCYWTISMHSQSERRLETSRFWLKTPLEKLRGVSMISNLPCLRFLSAYQRLYCAVLSSVYVLATPAMHQLARLRGGPRVPVFGSISGGLRQPVGSTTRWAVAAKPLLVDD